MGTTEVSVGVLGLPPQYVLLPGIVMRMPAPANTSLPEVSPSETIKAIRALIPILGKKEVLISVFPQDPEGKPGKIGTLARVIRQPEITKSQPSMLVQGLCRVSFASQVSRNEAKVRVHVDPNDSKYSTELIDDIKTAVSTLLLPWGESGTVAVKRFVSFAEGISSPATLVDILASVLPLEFSDKLAILETFDGLERANRLLGAIEKATMRIQNPIAKKTESDGPVRRPVRTIALSPKALPPSRPPSNSPREDDDDGLGHIEKVLKEANLSEEGKRIVDRELRRIKRMSPSQAEYQVCRTFLETLSDIPWNSLSKQTLDANTVSNARAILDKDHYGLQKVKKRLLEYLAVLYLQQRAVAKATNENTSSDTPVRAPILLLVGPPGVGKTSLAKSVARALNRKVHRIALGGVRDEAEIRGHRRTYIGAMPGVVIQGLRKARTMNPVFVLDEVDKVSQGLLSAHGDPSAALLEVLDPEQNSGFVDHYVSFPVDLSQVIFIATANSTDTIPGPLLDRMEVIRIDGYTYLEKRHIAQNYLLPKQLRLNALDRDALKLPDDILNHIAVHYTHESGVRGLEREIGTICRGWVVENFDKTTKEPHEITGEEVTKYLGLEKFHNDVINDQVDEYTTFDGKVAQRETHGLVNGLAYMGSGTGGLLVFEASLIPHGSGKLKLTGKLGNVISESAQISMSWVRAHAAQLEIDLEELKSCDVHLHAPAGAIPKDGPSAGVAMTVCLVSLMCRRPVPRDIAMTGEITLRGKILPVGGVREKLLGAHMAGVRRVILPYHCRQVVEDECQFVNDLELAIFYVKYIWDAFALVWPEVERFREPLAQSSL